MRQIKSIKGQVKKMTENTDEEEGGQAQIAGEPLNRTYLNTKILEIIISLNKQFNDVNSLETSEEAIYDIALDWVDLVDKNNQGGINLSEFYLSFCGIEDLIISDHRFDLFRKHESKESMCSKVKVRRNNPFFILI